MLKGRAFLLSCCISGIISGCASWFMVGSEPASGQPPKPLAVYKADKCTFLANGTSLDGPKGQTYYLVNATGTPALLELDGTNNGAKYTNHWVDADGDHFFAYVKGNQAWHFILPIDRTKPGTRLVFLQYAVDQSSGLMKPVGTPTVSCPMIP